ncbi:IS3 family transposase [Scytonema tolypothrichoides VB-61278]|nr:IS3 family transposase [Scytonema tolypothrichoides VB-61278]
MSTAERRDAVRFLASKGVSVQRGCELLHLQRATFDYKARPAAEDGLLAELEAIAQVNPRYGYRRAWALVRRKRTVNRKRVHRLWKRAKLQVKHVKRPRKPRERPPPLCALYPNHVWAYDFVQDQDMHGRTFYILTVMDEFTREGLAIAVADATSAEWVIAVLSEVVALHGAPENLRSDNGAEFVALAVQAWLARRQIRTLYIDPGCPWQNGKEERFNGTVRDECLNLHFFASLAEARVRLEAFRHHYNTDRPHSRLDYTTPAAFRKAWEQAQVQQRDSLIST